MHCNAQEGSNFMLGCVFKVLHVSFQDITITQHGVIFEVCSYQWQMFAKGVKMEGEFYKFKYSTSFFSTSINGIVYMRTQNTRDCTERICFLSACSAARN